MSRQDTKRSTSPPGEDGSSSANAPRSHPSREIPGDETPRSSEDARGTNGQPWFLKFVSHTSEEVVSHGNEPTNGLSHPSVDGVVAGHSIDGDANVELLLARMKKRLPTSYWELHQVKLLEVARLLAEGQRPVAILAAIHQLSIEASLVHEGSGYAVTIDANVLNFRRDSQL